MTNEQLVKGGVAGITDQYRVLAVEGPWACVRERRPFGSDVEDPTAPTRWMSVERLRAVMIAEEHANDCCVNGDEALINKDNDAAVAWLDLETQARAIRDEIVGVR